MRKTRILSGAGMRLQGGFINKPLITRTYITLAMLDSMTLEFGLIKKIPQKKKNCRKYLMADRVARGGDITDKDARSSIEWYWLRH